MPTPLSATSSTAAVCRAAVPGPAADDLLAVTVQWSQGTVVLTGELDRESAHHLLDALSALSATSSDTWSVDAAGVTFCDAGGLRALAQAQTLATGNGRELRLIAPSRCVRRLLELTDLDGRFPHVSAPAGETPPAPVDLAAWRPTRARRAETASGTFRPKRPDITV